MSEVGLPALPRIGMDFSMKVTAETGPDQRDSCGESQTDVASPLLQKRFKYKSAEQPEGLGSHPCPACPLVLSSARELTHHLRGHNSPRANPGLSASAAGATSDGGSGPEDADYACGVCHKVLSSASSLDRHVLVHSGERPFKCKYCDMAFTTNGNMNRHLRTAHRSLSPGGQPAPATPGPGQTASCSASDSEEPGSSDSEARPHRRAAHAIQDEYNNNEIKKRSGSPSATDLAGLASVEAKRRRRARYERDEDAEDEEEEEEQQLRREPQPRRLQLAGRTEPLGCCELCGRRDFATAEMLEAHRYAAHGLGPLGPARQSVVGFGDLTFTDFSSGKFPAIARLACEQALHRPASGEAARFQCRKCTRAFPCQSALEAHELDCGRRLSASSGPVQQQQQQQPLRAHSPQQLLQAQLAQQPSLEPGRYERLGRDDFFAGLDLQNKAALAEAREGKDLADIQSIISLTSRSSILQNISRAEASTPENCPVRQQAFGSSGSSSTPSSECHEEEAQDDFAAEFRKMKLKGEFPCRLCSMIFPNLRALKGHNRNHINVAQGMPFPCNICAYTAVDKATLLKHLKSHNGARPYECSLCNYAFTTKANCERHVRNRHGKMSRDEIKSVLIYHPSEDSANDPPQDVICSPRTSSAASGLMLRDEVRKALVYPSDEPSHSPVAQPPQPAQQIRVKDSAQLGYRYDKPELYPRPPSHQLDYAYHDGLKQQQQQHKQEDDADSRSSDDELVPLVNETKADAHQRSHGQPIDLKKPSEPEERAEPRTNPSSSEDAPLDLTVDVLDLSKKVSAEAASAAAAAAAAAAKPSKEEEMTTEPGVEDLSARHRAEELYNTRNQLLLTQAYLKANQLTAQPALLESLYSGAQLPYPNFGAFSGAAGLLQPFGLFGQHLFGHPDMSINSPLYKELVRGLRTSGGSLVEGPAGSGYPQQPAGAPGVPSAVDEYARAGGSPSRLLAKSIQPTRERLPAVSGAGAASTKLVMKNGMLMPKQKQRRYRTERPFSCEHCAAKFTLRSNMERHVKQQHPQHWSQKPRGAHSARGRPPANPPTLLQSLRQPQPATARQRLYEPYPQAQLQARAPSAEQPSRHAISDQVKYAILAQQLKAIKPEEAEQEAELVIDEHASARDKESSAVNQAPVKLMNSLLRGKLEASAEADEAMEKQHSLINDKHADNIKREFEAERDAESKSCRNEEDEEEEKMSADEDEDEEEDEEEEEGEKRSREKRDIDPMSIVKIELHTMDGLKRESGESEDLASVSEILDNASQNYQQQFHSQYMSDEEGLIGSMSDCNQSGSDEKSDSVNSATSSTPTFKKKRMKKKKKKSAYSMAPNRVICPYCQRPFPWTSSLRRHILTHTGQKPYRCPYCTLFFTTKSNCDRHLLRKHKNLALKLKRAASVSSPEPQEPSSGGGSSTTGPSQFSMRNVPERPFKCNQCPSSTFSTLGNLKKHKSTKHTSRSGHSGLSGNSGNSGSESASSEPQHSPSECNHQQQQQEGRESPRDEQQHKHNDHSGYESQSSGVSESPDPLPEQSSRDNGPAAEGSPSSTSSSSANGGNSSANQLSSSSLNGELGQSAQRKPSPQTSPGPQVLAGETPFKCHMCDSGFAERQDCLDHLRIYHEEAYERLMARGALEKDYDGNDPSDVEENKRVRVTDYSNRKVICVFCMRRFWSAEDLRRHMRTHTGERPYTCDICAQRFTLKHSMLRHRKKHDSPDSAMYVGTSGDEDSVAGAGTALNQQQQQAPGPRMGHQTGATPGSGSSSSSTSSTTAGPRRLSLPQVASVATADAAPSGLMRPYENGLAALGGRLAAAQEPSSAQDAAEHSSDLISNLLGIGENIIDKAIQSSVDDAAKLLGIKENQE